MDTASDLSRGGERPAIPPSIKDLVWHRSEGRCEECGEPILSRAHAEFDHRPALWARTRDASKSPRDPSAYTPHANDPAYIQVLHGRKSGIPCHRTRTSGTVATSAGSDVNAFHKAARLRDATASFHRRMAGKAGATDPGSGEHAEGREPGRKRGKSSRLCSAPFRGWRSMRGKPVWRQRDK